MNLSQIIQQRKELKEKAENRFPNKEVTVDYSYQVEVFKLYIGVSWTPDKCGSFEQVLNYIESK